MENEATVARDEIWQYFFLLKQLPSRIIKLLTLINEEIQKFILRNAGRQNIFLQDLRKRWREKTFPGLPFFSQVMNESFFKKSLHIHK